MQIFTQNMKNETFSRSPKVAFKHVGSYYFICPGFKKCTLENRDGVFGKACWLFLNVLKAVNPFIQIKFLFLQLYWGRGRKVIDISQIPDKFISLEKYHYG